MEALTIAALAIFAVTIVIVITGWIDSTVAALLGATLMVWIGLMSEDDAFKIVDWNVMAILVSIWTIAGYFGKSGIPEWLSVKALQLSRGNGGLLIVILSMLSGLVSMVVDNVVVILMFAPVAIPLARHLGLPLTPLVLMIGFSANFMGSAMLLGDLPPQMMHSVSGAEFFDFIWFKGKPSSFPILLVTFAITLGIMYALFFRKFGGAKAVAAGGDSMGEAKIPDKLFATIVVGGFVATIVAMSLREHLGMKLGFIAMTGALVLVLVLELLGDKVKKPSFEEIIQELDWRAVFFYVALFALVGGLEKTGLLEKLAHQMAPIFAQSSALGATLLYWVTIPIVGIVEHDAYILTFLYTVRDLAQQGVDPWPLWWMLLWSGTLGSNLTIAGAPALYVAANICEREENRRVSLREFLRWSVPFTLISCLICYILGMVIWVL
ncbi:MAG TPA: SLC13 family permease [Usitatibacteraceae bacterium]|nr:SLC13 family permease [Usitatibacteraceae bacterium]